MFCLTSEISLLYLTLKQGIQCRLCSSCWLLEAYTRWIDPGIPEVHIKYSSFSPSGIRRQRFLWFKGAYSRYCLWSKVIYNSLACPSNCMSPFSNGITVCLYDTFTCWSPNKTPVCMNLCNFKEHSTTFCCNTLLELNVSVLKIDTCDGWLIEKCPIILHVKCDFCYLTTIFCSDTQVQPYILWMSTMILGKR